MLIWTISREEIWLLHVCKLQAAAWKLFAWCTYSKTTIHCLNHCMFYATQTINAIDEILRAFQKKLMFHCRAWFLWTDTCAGQRILYFRRFEFDRHQRWCICCFSKSLLKELKTYLVLLWQDQYPERQKQAASPAKGKEIEFTLFFSYSICSSWEISCPWEMSLKWVGPAEPVGPEPRDFQASYPALSHTRMGSDLPNRHKDIGSLF